MYSTVFEREKGNCGRQNGVQGKCVIFSVQSCCEKDLKQQTSVTATALLELRALFGKQRIVHPRSQSKGLKVAWLPLFKLYVSFPQPFCSLPYANQGQYPSWIRKGDGFVSSEVPTRLQIFALFPFLWLFPPFFASLLAVDILDSVFYSN